LLGCEAVAAVNRPAGPRLKRNFRNAAALAARRLEHFASAAAAGASLSSGRCFTSGAAIAATAGFVGKALTGKKLLLACRELE
jgi:hypothetical protein